MNKTKYANACAKWGVTPEQIDKAINIMQCCSSWVTDMTTSPHVMLAVKELLAEGDIADPIVQEQPQTERHIYGQLKRGLPWRDRIVRESVTPDGEKYGIYRTSRVPIITYNHKSFELDMDELVDLARVAGLFDKEGADND